MIFVGRLAVTFKVILNLKLQTYPILSLWVYPRDKPSPTEGRISKLGTQMHLSPVTVPIDLGLIDLDLQLLPNIASLFHWRRLYIFTKVIASECSTSYMAPHIYWFICTQTGSRNGSWKSLVLYLVKTNGAQQNSTRRSGLNFSNCYQFSPYHKHFTCRNFICQHSAITETTVKQHPLACILFDFQHWALLNRGKHLRQHTGYL